SSKSASPKCAWAGFTYASSQRKSVAGRRSGSARYSSAYGLNSGWYQSSGRSVWHTGSSGCRWKRGGSWLRVVIGRLSSSPGTAGLQPGSVLLAPPQEEPGWSLAVPGETLLAQERVAPIRRRHERLLDRA